MLVSEMIKSWGTMTLVDEEVVSLDCFINAIDCQQNMDTFYASIAF